MVAVGPEGKLSLDDGVGMLGQNPPRRRNGI